MAKDTESAVPNKWPIDDGPQHRNDSNMKENQMSGMEMFTSLADLAGANTDAYAAVKNRLQRAGIYLFTLTDVKLSLIESDDPEAKTRANLVFTGLIDAYYPLASRDGEEDGSTFDPESMVGKAYREQYTIWLEDFAESVGLLKGKYVSAHLPATGVLGGVEGQPGWLDNAVNSRVACRVRHVTKGDDTRVYYDWLGFKALAKLDIGWDEMGREPTDVHGNVIEIAA